MKKTFTISVLSFFLVIFLSTKLTYAGDPTSSAPTPSAPADKTISLFSNAYNNVLVDTWSAVWDAADLSNYVIGATDSVKKYSNLNYCGIEFTSQPIDATSMTHFHTDIWTPDAATLGIKLVDFGADGAYGGGDDVEHQLDYNSSTTPAIVTNAWISFDIPLSSFTNLVTKGHLAQLLYISAGTTVFVDNVYFYNASGSTSPLVSAPTPTQPADKTISLFSNAYTNVQVDTWSAVWDAADLSDYVIGATDSVKKYSNLNYCGIEFTSQPIDATTMTHFHTDIWTPDASIFNIKLVDFGADGMYGGGDDVEQELAFDANTSPAIIPNSWISFDIPLSSFTNLVTKGHLAQLLFISGGSTVFVDNVYFYSATVPTEPTVSAPTPSLPGSSVISLFSNAYTNVLVDTWSAVWDAADLSSYVIGATDSVKKYTNLNYCGVEFTTQTINADNMTYFHTDIWTPDASILKIKLVDFGADGMYAGGDDVEQELAFDATTTPAVVKNTWVSFDLPLSSFTNLTTRAHMAQLLYVSAGNTVYVDNVYFANGASGIQDLQTVNNLFTTFPTLCNSYLNLEINQAQRVEGSFLTIYNTVGEVVFSKSLTENKITVPSVDFSNGMYFVSVQSGNQIQLQKIIVQH